LPDPLSRPPSFEDSILMVEDRMRRRIGGFERLDRQALRRYAARAPAAGWRLTVPTPDGERPPRRRRAQTVPFEIEPAKVNI
jgi:hypothetical protein